MIKDLVVCADRNSVTYTDVFFKSLFIHADDKSILNVYFISYDFPKELIIDLKQKLRLIKHIKLIPITLDTQHPNFFKILDNIKLVGNKSSYYSKSMFMKLFISECLPKNIDWCFYLDLDSIILKNISSILEYELDENIVYYGCKDHELSQQLNDCNDNLIVSNQSPYIIKVKHAIDEANKLKQHDTEHYTDYNDINLIIPEDFENYRYKCFSDNSCFINLKAIREKNYFTQYLLYLTKEIKQLPLVNYFLNQLHANEWQCLPDSYGLNADLIIKNELNQLKQKFNIETSEGSHHNSVSIPYIVKYKINKPLDNNAKLPYRKVFFYLHINTYFDIGAEIKNINTLISQDKYNAYTHLTPIGFIV